MIDLNRIKGVVVPLVTPLLEGERVDGEGLRRLVRYVLSGGVHGLFVMGTSGEFVRLRDEEWRRAIEVVVEEAQRKVPVYAGISDGGVYRVIEKIKLVEKMGIDVVVATAPYYFPLTQQEEVVRFYEKIAKDSPLPLIIYNIPFTTGVWIKPQAVKKISQVGEIIGIKDSSGDLAGLRKIIRLFKGSEKFRIFVGQESIYLEGLASGAHGVVPSMANVAPRLCVELYEAVKGGRLKEAGRLKKQLDDLNQMNKYSKSWLSWLAVRKVALELMGICSQRLAEPFIPLSKEVMLKIEKKLKRHKLI